MKTIKDVLNTVLKDDETEMGGIEYPGETVSNFIQHTDLSLNDSIDLLNEELKDSGIKTIQK